MKNNFSKAQSALRKFLSFQRQFATALYKMKYRAKFTPPPRKCLCFSELSLADENRKLYKTIYGDKFFLNNIGCIDNNIKDFSVWEPESTSVIKHLLKQGMVVLDIGANIGYYTVIMSKLVGEQGKVLAFEPTKHFYNVLECTVEVNNLKNVELYNFGLSNENIESEISIGEHSATIHWLKDSPRNGGNPLSVENIRLKKLDDIIDSLNISKLDFIKIDVDGHEPAFLEGAWETLKKYKPVILMEIDHQHYKKAGYTAWDFYNKLKDKGFHVYSEKDMSEYLNEESFLVECGNFNAGANIILMQE
jgi:FkbM family methyltransferase